MMDTNVRHILVTLFTKHLNDCYLSRTKLRTKAEIFQQILLDHGFVDTVFFTEHKYFMIDYMAEPFMKLVKRFRTLNHDTIADNITKALAVCVFEDTQSKEIKKPTHSSHWRPVIIANIGMEFKLALESKLCPVVTELLLPYQPQDVSYLELSPGVKI